jgi:hypothetical protein
VREYKNVIERQRIGNHDKARNRRNHIFKQESEKSSLQYTPINIRFPKGINRIEKASLATSFITGRLILNYIALNLCVLRNIIINEVYYEHCKRNKSSYN